LALETAYDHNGCRNPSGVLTQKIVHISFCRAPNTNLPLWHLKPFLMQFFNTPFSAVTHKIFSLVIGHQKLMHKFMAHFCILFGTFFGVKPATGADLCFLKIFTKKGAFSSDKRNDKYINYYGTCRVTKAKTAAPLFTGILLMLKS
jgi:hypothetical protein